MTWPLSLAVKARGRERIERERDREKEEEEIKEEGGRKGKRKKVENNKEMGMRIGVDQRKTDRHTHELKVCPFLSSASV